MFNNLDYLIYSSHKTSTQSVIKTLRKNNYKSMHLHNLINIKISEEEFITNLKEYNIKNNKKLKIITIIRNPFDRLLSSFFQTNHSDIIFFKKILPENSLISLNDIDKLYSLYKKIIENKSLQGLKESMTELKEIFNFNFQTELIKKENYYHYSNDLCELYVLDFNILISNNALSYMQATLNINLTEYQTENLSSDKLYYDKYINLKKQTINDTELADLIKSFYEKDELSLYYDFLNLKKVI